MYSVYCIIYSNLNYAPDITNKCTVYYNVDGVNGSTENNAHRLKFYVHHRTMSFTCEQVHFQTYMYIQIDIVIVTVTHSKM